MVFDAHEMPEVGVLKLEEVLKSSLKRSKSKAKFQTENCWLRSLSSTDRLNWITVLSSKQRPSAESEG